MSAFISCAQMKLNKEYTVDFAGLKQGVHEYAFEVNKTFFSIFDNEDYNDAAFKIEVVLEKQSTMLIFHFSIKGKVNVDCDRCLEPVDVKVTCEDKLIVKFGSEHEADSEELVVIPESDYQIDLSPYIYEFILVNIPQKRKHKKRKSKLCLCVLLLCNMLGTIFDTILEHKTVKNTLQEATQKNVDV